jgi:hypothetical protein
LCGLNYCGRIGKGGRFGTEVKAQESETTAGL